MPCQKYQIFIFIFIFCNRNANFCYFLQWQCNLFNFFCIGNAKFLILAFAIQMFCIFCIGNILFFSFLALGMQIFFIFGTGNAFLKNFWHWECKFLLYFALGMHIFYTFCTGNANFFYFQHLWKWHNFENIFAFQMHETDNFFLQPIPSSKQFCCNNKWSVTKYVQNTHDLSNPDLWDSPYLRNKFLLTNFHWNI